MTLRQRFNELSLREGLSAGWQLFIFALVLLAIISRDVSHFSHAQFYAEDGEIWYADAYNIGWLHSLALPQAGYLHTQQRLGADLALLVPLWRAPLVMVIVGLLFQALPVPILLSSQCRNWVSLPMRIAFAAVYVGIPNAGEVHVVLTNAQWHLAIVLALLAFATPPPTWIWRVFDVTILMLGALSGPFALLLMPLVFVFWWFRRQRWSLVVLALLGAGVILQLLSILRYPQQRFVEPLGATPTLFVRLIGGNAILGALLGAQNLGARLPLVCSFLALLLGVTLIVYCFRYVSLEVRLFFVYCLTALAGGLRAPAFEPTNQQLWPVMLQALMQRYWFIPSLALLFAVLWCTAFARARVIRVIAIGFTVLLCVGIWRHWRLPPMRDMGFRQSAAAFEAATPGTRVIIPIFPGGKWQMDLVKKKGP